MSAPAVTLATRDEQCAAAAVTALLERLPLEVVSELLAGMPAGQRLNVLDVVTAHRARMAGR